MHTSGITVNQQLATQFVECCEQKDIAFVKIEIEQDNFVKTGEGRTNAGDGLEQIFQAAQGACEDKTPAYILIQPETDKWMLIFYCPDNSKVRQRMVYASSCTAIKDGLGSSKFISDYNISDKSECSLEEYKKSTAVLDKEDLMTQSERTKEEAENESVRSIQSSMVAAVVGIAVPISDDALAQVQSVMSPGGPNTVYLDLDFKSETLNAIGPAADVATNDLAASLPADMPCFIIHSFAHEVDGESKSINLLIYYCPGKAKPKNKMFYSTAKSNVLSMFGKYGDIKNMEISEAAEITADALYADLYPNTEKKTNFKKPASKGKGKRAFRGAKFASS